MKTKIKKRQGCGGSVPIWSLLVALAVVVSCSKPREAVLADIERSKAEAQRASALAEAKSDVEGEERRLMAEFEELQKPAPDEAKRGRNQLQELLAAPYKGTDLERYQWLRDEMSGKTASEFIEDQAAKQLARKATQL